MYYRRYKDGSVLDWSAVKYSDDCIYSDGEVIKAWDGLMYIKGEEPPEPRELIEKRIQQQMSDVVQRMLDAKAREYLYDSCLSVCSYVNTGDAKFDAEGQAFREWRTSVWRKCYEILDQVKSGKRDIPSVEQLIDEMPKLVIKYTSEQ